MQALQRWLGERRPVLAIDTETTGLRWWEPGFLRMVQFGDAHTAWAVPYAWWGRPIREMIEKYTGCIVMHNAKFDVHALESAGIAVPRQKIQDTKIISWLIDPPGRHSLKPLTAKLIDPRAAYGQQALHKGMHANGWTWATVPVDFDPYWQYAALDTALTAALYDALDLSPNYETAYEREMAVQFAMLDAETRGVRLDLKYVADLRRSWTREMFVLEAALEEAGVSNPNARRQIIEVLQNEDWEPEHFTPTGEPRLDEGILKGLDHPVAAAVLRYRRLRKWDSAYLANFQSMADSGVLHPTINTLQARTGRMSITEPALQTLPRGAEIRRAIIPRPGNVLASVDYDQIEYRIFAHFSQEPGLLEAIRSGVDLHSATAAAVFGPNFTPAQRQISKNANFAKVFGAGLTKFAATAGISEQEAAEFMDAYAERFPGVERFMEHVQAVGRQREAETGVSYITTPWGTQLPADRGRHYTLVNYLVQGTAAQVFKQAVLNLEAAGLGQYFVLPVHDEAIFDIPQKELAEVLPEIVAAMEDHTSFSVPLTVGTGQGTSWAKAKG